jgi:hypothetical protein
MVFADAGNGVSSSADVREWLFINTDLTVHLTRLPAGDWVGMDAHSVYDASGIGAAHTVLHDERGPIGHGAQSLFVAPQGRERVAPRRGAAGRGAPRRGAAGRARILRGVAPVTHGLGRGEVGSRAYLGGWTGGPSMPAGDAATGVRRWGAGVAGAVAVGLALAVSEFLAPLRRRRAVTGHLGGVPGRARGPALAGGLGDRDVRHR